jgi:hypothetical protein
VRQPIKILSLALVIGLAAGGFAYLASLRLSAKTMMGTDDLAWLKHEFKLNEAEMSRIRNLHEGYLPKCGEMCQQIAAKRNELDALVATNAANGEIKQKLVELGNLRAKCQAQMLEHFEEVSRAMPQEQGTRYLAEMKRLTLASHQQLENSMSGTSVQAHGHH